MPPKLRTSVTPSNTTIRGVSSSGTRSRMSLEKCGYTADEVAGSLARASDMRAYYSAEDEARFGVVGIELTKCEHAEI